MIPVRQKSRLRSLLGFTLTEVMIGTAVSTILSAGMVTGAILLQKNFQASTQYARDQAKQARVLDYIGLDLRRATTASVVNGTLTITIPDYYDSSGVPRDPALSMGRVYYNSATSSVTIRYSQQNGQITRQEGTTSTVIADGVQDFQLNFVNSGQVVETSISFKPTFQQRNQGNSAGTTVYTRTLLRNLLQS